MPFGKLICIGSRQHCSAYPLLDMCLQEGVTHPALNRMKGIGGCASVDGCCIGCTAPAFADRYLSIAALESEEG